MLTRAGILLLFFVNFTFQDPYHNTTYVTRSMFGKQMLLEKCLLINTVILRLNI